MNQIISILNHKGGTGKTTTTLNLGKAFEILGKEVLLVDLDPQSNLSQSLGIEEEDHTITQLFKQTIDELPIHELSDHFHIVPASLDLSAVEPTLYSNINSYFHLKGYLERVRKRYDYILIDCPPSLGVLTQNALIASDKVIVTVQPQYLSLKGLDTVYGLVHSISKRLNPEISILGLVITQSNNTRLSKDTIELLNKSFQQKVYQSVIRQSVALAEASTYQKDIFSYSPQSNGAIDYMNLAKEILQ